MRERMGRVDAQAFVSAILRGGGIALALIVLILVFSALSPDFSSTANVRNIMSQITINTILAVGMTFVILVAGIDLSVGSVMAFSMMVAGVVMSGSDLGPGVTILLGVAAGLGVGLVCGFVNGAIAETWRLPAFIVTLGMLNIARGAALLTTGARTLYEFPRPLIEFGTSTIMGAVFPSIFAVALVAVLISWFVLTRTVFGRMLYAIGNNQEAVRLAGHNPAAFKIAAFSICGFAAGIAGVVNMSRLTVATPIVGVGFELNAIAAVIIGGTNLFGGRGSVVGTFFGACIIGVLQNGLVLLGVEDFLRQMLIGFVIILAVILDHYRTRYLAAR